MMVKVGDAYPMSGRHAGHDATIVAVDAHGVPSWEVEAGAPAPTLTVACSCGALLVTDLVEAVAA